MEISGRFIPGEGFFVEDLESLNYRDIEVFTFAAYV